MSTKREDIVTMSDLNEEFATYLHEICTFIEESAKKRVDAIKVGQIHLIEEALSAEIALASGLGRIDIIMFLVEHLQKITQLEAQIQACELRDYQERFDPIKDNS